MEVSEIRLVFLNRARIKIRGFVEKYDDNPECANVLDFWGEGRTQVIPLCPLVNLGCPPGRNLIEEWPPNQVVLGLWPARTKGSP